MSPITINIRDLRNQLADSVNRVAYVKQSVIVTKHGRPVVAIINMEDYERVFNPRARYVSQSAWDKGFEVIDQIRTQNQNLKPAKIDQLVSQSLASVRDQSRS